MLKVVGVVKMRNQPMHIAIYLHGYVYGDKKIWYNDHELYKCFYFQTRSHILTERGNRGNILPGCKFVYVYTLTKNI